MSAHLLAEARVARGLPPYQPVRQPRKVRKVCTGDGCGHRVITNRHVRDPFCLDCRRARHTEAQARERENARRRYHESKGAA